MVLGTKAAEALEKIVDQTNVMAVLEMLVEVCELKAEHIRENWQDEGLAKRWTHDAKIIATAARRVQN